MTGKNLMMAAFAAATIVATPALAQMQSGTTPTDSSATSGGMQSGAMQSGSMQSGSMQNGAMNSSAPAMTAAQTRTMKKCQAMSSDMMAKNKSCTKLMKMHPEMSTSGGM